MWKVQSRLSIISNNSYNNFSHRSLPPNGSPKFVTSLSSLNVTQCFTITYVLPNVNDPISSSYSISARLLNHSYLPDWIVFDSRMFTISPPKTATVGNDYSMNVRITDSTGPFSDNPLLLRINAALQISLQTIPDVILANSGSKSFSFRDILALQSQYDLKGNISILSKSGNPLPSCIQETLNPYYCLVNCSSSEFESGDMQLMFKVIDYCGDPYYTNTFSISMVSNLPPKIISMPKDATFYQGQQHGVLLLPKEMFSDPGDKLNITTTLCAEESSSSVKTIFDETENIIDVYYSAKFYGKCTFAITTVAFV